MSPTTLPIAETKRIWQQTCSQLQLQLSPAVYSTWIISNPITSIIYHDENTAEIIITSPTAFHSTNLKKNLHIHLKNALDRITSRDTTIVYKVGDPSVPSSAPKNQQGFQAIKATIMPGPPQRSGVGGGGGDEVVGAAEGIEAAKAMAADEQKPESIKFSAPQQTPFASTGTTRTASPRVEDLFSEDTMQSAALDRIQAIARKVGLRPDYTFTTFAVSTTNEMAHAAATAVSNRPGQSYNPLFLYGGVGVGKTHLMHAIGFNILSNNPNATIIYCTGEEFTNEIVHAIQTKKANAFKAKYRNADVLLIDDVQFIAGKNAVQEEFFHTFNALTKQQSQIVLTSDRPPYEITLLEDRLRSRFEAGLMIDIQQPSFELRTAILLVKAKAAKLQIPIELAKTIASQVESARKIEGIITSIRSAVELRNREITPELIEEILKVEITDKRPPIKASPQDVIRTVANHYHLKQTAIKGKRRVKSLVQARHIAMYLLKQELDLPLVEIGKWFSNRDHTTVLHAVNKIEDQIVEDSRMQRDVSALRMTLAATN